MLTKASSTDLTSATALWQSAGMRTPTPPAVWHVTGQGHAPAIPKGEKCPRHSLRNTEQLSSALSYATMQQIFLTHCHIPAERQVEPCLLYSWGGQGPDWLNSM